MEDTQSTQEQLVPQTEQETAEQRYTRLYTQQNQQTAQTNQELLNAIQSLKDEVAQMKSAPQTQATPAPTAADQAEWVERIRQGDFAGAQRVIAQEVERSIQPALDRVRQESYQQALTATQVDREMDKYLSKVRTENPELVQFERYLNAPVSQRIEAAKAAGKIRSSDDLVREYKAAVDAEVGELRNMGLQFRAAGKSEALTRNREVLASTPLQPQQVQRANPTAETTEPPIETNDDYFSRRRAGEAQRKGMNL